METNRANVTFLVNELLGENLVREGAQGSQKVRGRKPTFLYLNSQKSLAVAIDVRASRTYLMITDSIGKQIIGLVYKSLKRSTAGLVAGRDDLHHGDRPVSADMPDRDGLWVLDRLHEDGTAVVVVTHDGAVAARAHRLLAMRDGQIVEGPA